ncbi:hypothetical protein HZ326_5877 [Fusarium oxysporum f. sp. albedinis]|nr:hypothetical protein HZ326_5877 [Fusarium oxysporum f. sp. albedinis]
MPLQLSELLLMWNDAGWRSWFCFLAHGYFTAFFNDQQPRKPPKARLTCFRLSFLPLLFSLRHYLLRKEALRKLRRCRGDCDATWCWLYTLQLHFSFPNPVRYIQPTRIMEASADTPGGDSVRMGNSDTSNDPSTSHNRLTQLPCTN